MEPAVEPLNVATLTNKFKALRIAYPDTFEEELAQYVVRMLIDIEDEFMRQLEKQKEHYEGQSDRSDTS